MIRYLSGIVFLTFSLLGMSAPAYALSCSATVGSINFGNVNVLSGASPLATAVAPVAVTCSKGLLELPGDVTVCVYLGAGSGGSDSTQRFLNNGVNNLSYNLYKDVARTQIWGSYAIFSTAGPKRYVFTASTTLVVLGGSTTITDVIHASVNPAQSAAPVGTYSSAFTAVHALIRYATGNVPCPSSGNTNISTFNVTATVVANCLLDAQDLNFGAVSSLSANLDQSSALSLSCTNAASWSISMSNGANYGGIRRMRLGSTLSYINYELFRDASRSQPWATGGGNELTGTGTGGNQSLTIYGRVRPQATPTAGLYEDTVIATVTF